VYKGLHSSAAQSKTNTSSNSQDTDDACLGFDTISEKCASLHLQGYEVTPSLTLGKPENLHVHDCSMICKMKTQEYFTQVLFSQLVFLLVILKFITLIISQYYLHRVLFYSSNHFTWLED
jgi:hypothetical protein